MRRFLIIAMLLVLAACQNQAAAPVIQAADVPDHPLNDSLWLPRKGVTTDWETVEGLIAKARFVLVGEKHDNPYHHKVQARIVSIMARGDRRPALVWEMITESQRDGLDTYQDGGSVTGEGLGEALKWGQGGWPAWSMYQPIAEAAIEKGLRHHPGNLDKEDVGIIAREGFLELPNPTARSLVRHAVWTLEDNEALTRDLVEGHCGLMPGEMMRPMARVQRSRDAVMAAGLLEADIGDGALLIAGNGHVRGDRGVARYLRPEKRVLTIGLFEVMPDADNPADYLDHPNQYDVMIFTPRVDTPDRCVELRKRFGKLKKG